MIFIIRILFKSKYFFRLSIPYNQDHFQVFENDEQMAEFLADIEENLDDPAPILKKCINFEFIFTRDDQVRMPNFKDEASTIKVQEIQKINIGIEEYPKYVNLGTKKSPKYVNLGTKKSPKYVNLGTDCTQEEIDQYPSLFKELFYVLTWNYGGLKACDKSIFQHIIPLKEGTNPFKQKLRIINRKWKPLVKIEFEKSRKDRIIFPIRHS